LKFPDPEQIATELLERARASSPPVNLDNIASLWQGLNITAEELDREGYLIDLGELGGEIVVKATDIPPRRRFSIAHELGHWVLRHSGTPLDVTTLGIGSLNGARSTLEEKWCNQFAAALLMPQDWVLKDIRRAKISGLLNAVISCPEVYQVSESAFMTRVSELTPVSIFKIKQRDGQRFLEQEHIGKRVRKKVLYATIEEVIQLLTDSENPVKVTHDETQMVSMHKLMSNDSGRRKWLVCILPTSSPSPSKN
jgi:Zn-dependent peptidase ImmA (M78 family)